MYVSDRPALVAVDWGSSRLRIALVGADGTELARRVSDRGILSVPRSEQRPLLIEELSRLGGSAAGLPVYAAGMIGSRSGFAGTEAVATPASLRAVAAGVRPEPLDDTASVWVIPGLIDRSEGRNDLMRGEEVQILAWLDAQETSPTAVLVLPGTHSKWVRVTDGRIVTFHTFPTGELYAALSSLPSLVQADPSLGTTRSSADRSRSFSDGVRSGAESRGLLHDLFLIRTSLLAGDGSIVMKDRLSGVLIGSEIAEAQRRGVLRPGEVPVLISAGALLERYRAAFRATDLPSTEVTDGFVEGILAIARERASEDFALNRAG